MPTDGRGRKRSPDYIPKEEAMPTTVPGLQAELIKLRRENLNLRKQIQKLRSKQA